MSAPMSGPLSGTPPPPGAAGRGVRMEPALWVRDDRYAVALALLVWLLTLLLIIPEGFDYSVLLGSAPMSGSLGSRMLWLGLLSAGVVVIIWRAALVWLLLPRLNLFLLAFLALVVASVAWSIAPSVTVRRLVRVTTIVVVAIAFALSAWHRERFQNVLRPVLTLVLAGSIVFVLLQPSLAVHHETDAGIAGSWRGLTNHKNTLGMVAGTALILWVHAGIARSLRLWVLLPGLALSLICLIGSRSSTSLMTMLFAIPMMLALMRTPRGLQPYMPYLVGLFALLLVVYALAVLRLVPGLEPLLEPISRLTGKDLSFTGRSDIWAIIIDQVREHPWLGGGYGAYWTGPESNSPSVHFMYQLYFYPGSAHNGYLDVVNDLGTVGLLCLLGFLAGYVGQALQVFALDRDQGALYLTLFLQHAISNLSESHWFSVLSVGFAIMVLATVALGRSLLDHRLQYYFGAPLAAPPRPAPVEARA